METLYYFKAGENPADFGMLGTSADEKVDFVVSSESSISVSHNTMLTNFIQNKINEHLILFNYVNSVRIEGLYFIYMILDDNRMGIPRADGIHYNRKRKIVYIDILFPDFEAFRTASQAAALQIMAEQTLRGARKYLSTVKGFDAERFCRDLENVFRQEKMML